MEKEKIIHRFNSGAKTYDLAADVQIVAARNLKNYLNNPILVEKSNNDSFAILEIGCGTGLFSRHLIKQFPHASILLSDISPEMTKVSHQRFANNPNIKVLCFDAEHMELNQSYDLIVSNMMLHWVSDFDVLIKKINSHLRPGGKFIFTLLGSHSLNEWREACNEKEIQNGLLKFPTAESILNSCPNMTIELEKHIVTYANAYDLLRTLKEIGGVATPNGYEMISAGVLRSVLRQFNSEFKASYEIIYGSVTK